ncbi:phospho-sugar mutase [Corynebacterium resistens]|nr:phospho-sugar mutase [Corynebacterium resistens]
MTSPDSVKQTSVAAATSPRLQFGTAGLRGPVGPGPGEMNVTTATRTTAGVAQWLKLNRTPLRRDGRYAVAVGYDARYGSQAMARATAETFAGAGFEVTLIAEPAPTPVLAWLVRDRGLDAGVQITASHNPASDNGYKLYLQGGSQLISPADREIEAAIAEQPATAGEIPRSEAKNVDLATVSGYVTDICRLVATGEQSVLHPRRQLRIVYTPLHGVGGNALEWALRESGFGDVHTVASQRWPDPTFPTVDFPNPEEPGATDALLDEAKRLDADLAIALDPDADRCMIGVRTDSGEGAHNYRMFRGDETGPLLAHRVMGQRGASKQKTPKNDPPVVATTIVSSQMLGYMAEARGWDYVETLTGFKHLARAADNRPGQLAFAYEEAIGTCPAPHIVADKDGIATALIAAAWAAELKAAGRSLAEEWTDLQKAYGIFDTAQVSARYATVEEAEARIAEVVANPPDRLGGLAVIAEPLVGTPGVRLTSKGSADWSPSGGSKKPDAEATASTDPNPDAGGQALQVRVVARPSGTEPKAKFYLEVSWPNSAAQAGGFVIDDATLAARRKEVSTLLDAVRRDVQELAGTQ